tara:strand:- start:1749 stop:2576 length:828 start_codon:yes stop_codon:yes gene_type:complete
MKNIFARDPLKIKEIKPMILRPMPLWESLLFFGIPAIIAILCIFKLYPYLVTNGFSNIMSYLICLNIPITIMLVTSFVALKIECNSIDWLVLRNRFRIETMDRRDWLWTIVLTLIMFITTGLLSVLLSYIIPELIGKGLIKIPDTIPPFIDIRIPQNIESIKAQMGINAIGNVTLLIIFIITLILGILGEEFLFRGYVLPRQELYHGKNAWVVHGILWMFAHSFKWWQMLALLPGTLALSFVSQRLKTTSPAVIAHFITNFVGSIGFVLIIIGYL